jgi:diadenosine tetraphosphate (Ap4A) HIT family hydrolase
MNIRRPRRSRVLWVCLLFALVISASAVVLLTPLRADVRGCQCDLTKPIDLDKQRECSLCIEAEKVPAYQDVFFLKDKNPTKPNRTLALPRVHTPGGHPLSQLTAEQRHVLWTAAILKAQELWGDSWAIAYNGEERRTQCHTHLHIGKLLDGQETDQFQVADDPTGIPAPEGTGLWVHPVAGKLHVHLGAQVNETVLMR